MLRQLDAYNARKTFEFDACRVYNKCYSYVHFSFFSSVTYLQLHTFNISLNFSSSSFFFFLCCLIEWVGRRLRLKWNLEVVSVPIAVIVLGC